MSSVSTDRRFGVNASKAVKVPCVVATTANITLSGEQTIDGVACVTGDRVLVWSQSDTVENGIWVVDSNNWSRAVDANDKYDLTKGSQVFIYSGTAYGNRTFYCTTSGTIIPGTSSINFAVLVASGLDVAEADSLAAAYALDLTGYDKVQTNSFYSGWASTVAGPKGGAVYHRDGTTGTASTAYSDNSGFYDANGDGFLISNISGTFETAQFGTYGDGSTADRPQLQGAIDYISALGGGILKGLPGDNYSVTITTAVTDNGLILKSGVDFQLNTATISLTCTGNVYGVRVTTNTKIRGGTIKTISSTTPGTQGIFHAPLSIGPAYSDGGTVASPSSYEGQNNWLIEDIDVDSVRSGSPMIQGTGGHYNGVVRNIRAPDSATIGGVVGFDWGTVGDIDSSDVPASREAFAANTGYTTHPHDIVIEQIHGGDLSYDSGESSRLIRLSGVYNFTVDGFSADGTTYSGVYLHAGDLGHEFAPSDVKRYRSKGIKVKNGIIRDANDGWGVFADCYADNIASAEADTDILMISSVSGTFTAAETITGGTSMETATVVTYHANAGILVVTSASGAFTDSETLTGGTSGATATLDNSGYTPLVSSISETDLELENISTYSDAGASVIPGFRIQNMIGGRAKDCNAYGHSNGILIETGCDYFEVEGGNIRANREHGVYVSGSDVPTGVILNKVRSYGNGTDSGFANAAGIYSDSSNKLEIRDCVLGNSSDSSQERGIWLTTSVTAARVLRNYVRGTNSGTAYVIGSSTTYTVLELFLDNDADSSISTLYSGSNIVPIRLIQDQTGVTVRHFTCDKTVLTSDTTPTAGAWIKGDIIWFVDPDAGDQIGTCCTTSGSQGTWKQFGAIAA